MNSPQLNIRSIHRVLFTLITFLVSMSLSFAGNIDSFLAQKLQTTSAVEKVPVIIYMKEQVNLQEMEYVLQQMVAPSERVPVDVRYRTIITAMHQVAERSQPAIIGRMETFATDGSLSNIQKFWIRNIIVAEATPSTIEEIAQWEEVETVYLDGILEREMPLNSRETESGPEGVEPGLKAINAHRLWAIGITGRGRVVMNIDTGVFGNNLSFNTRWRGTLPGVLPTWAWFDPSSGTTFPTDGDASSNHGTHTMGIMCGRYDATGDTIGVAPDANWIASNSLIGGSPHTSRSIASFQWAANPDSNINTMDDVPDAISNSWYDPNVQTTECSGASGYYTVIDAVEALGTAVVFSAGNNGPNPSTVTPPKNRLTSAVNIFSVGALDANTSGYPIASFSSRGPSVCAGPDSLKIKPEVSAPGVNVRSSSGTNGFRFLDGTSMACPHVAGAIALLRQAAPFLTGTEIKYYLLNTATDLGTSGDDNNYGKGLINVWEAYLRLPLNVGKVEGIVTSDGSPVNGVKVDFADSILQMGTTTTADGHFAVAARIDTPNTHATYTLRAQKFGYLTYADTVTIALDDTVMRNIQLSPAPGGILTVHTFDNDENAVRANVKVRFAGQTVADDVTDSLSGFYSTPLPTGIYTVIIDPPSPMGTRTFSNVEISENDTTLLSVLVRNVVEISPMVLNDTLAVGQMDTKTLSLTNTTNDSIRFRVSDDNGLLSRMMKKRATNSVIFPKTPSLSKNENDNRNSYPQTEGRGGPDAFGYQWIDSDEAGGPEFDWVDISATGTALNQNSPWVAAGTLSATDEGTIQVPLPFPFSFYGNVYNSLYIGTNGTLSFQVPTGSFYTNGPLPSPASGSALVDNFIAAFWDDLDALGNGVIYYGIHNGNFVVQWVNAERYSSTNPDYTFEAILKPSGEILLQYSQMGISAGTITSATLGIENANASIGLQVVNSAAYMHNNLALRIYLPDAPWISASPTTGTLQPNETREIAIQFNAAGLVLDTLYSAKLIVDAIHPDIAGSFNIPATLQVQLADSATLIVNRTTIAFGLVPLQETKRESIEVRNGGLTTLEVFSASSTNDDFTVSPTSATIPSGERMMMYIEYHPLIAGNDTGRIILMSNSQFVSRNDIFLNGYSAGIARISLRPNSFSVTSQASNDTLSQVMHIVNRGTDTLRFSIGELPGSSFQENAGRGGPDAFGYVWRDNNEGDGPRFHWNDIRGIGTAVTLPDNGSVGPFQLTFPFVFYGTTYNDVRISSNGFINFTSTSTGLTNGTLPSTATPNNAIYGFWDDLNPTTAGGEVHYLADAFNQRFVVQYTNVARGGDANSRVTFQIVLDGNGEIRCFYQTMTGTLNSSTIGIENSTGTIGLQVAYNNQYIQSNSAILFTRDLVSWLSVDTKEGVVAMGDSQAIQVRVHPREIFSGNYAARLRVRGNSLDTMFASVALQVLVGVNEGGKAIPTQFTLEQNYPNPFNPSSVIRYALPDEATISMQVFNVLGQEVATLLNNITQPAGFYEIVWNGTNNAGTTLSSGVYFYRMSAVSLNSAQSFTQMRKMLLMK